MNLNHVKQIMNILKPACPLRKENISNLVFKLKLPLIAAIMIMCSLSHFSKGNICSNKVGLEKFSEPKVTRKRKGLDLDVTTKKKAKLCSTINTSNHSEIENNIPVHSQGIALQNLNKFHNSLKCTIYHCQICQEAWPLKTKPKNYPNYICSRCSRDKCVPKKFSNERLYSKSIS